MEYIVRGYDLDHHITWEKKYDTLRKARKARKWLENDTGYPISIEEDF